MCLLFGTVANKKKTLYELLNVSLDCCINKGKAVSSNTYMVHYPSIVEKYVTDIQSYIDTILPSEKRYLSRWISLRLLDENSSINDALKSNLNIDLDNNPILEEKLFKIKSELKEEGLSLSSLRDDIITTLISLSEAVSKKVCSILNNKYSNTTKKIDKILTSKKFGIPIMLLFFALIFWITIVGANYPSKVLFDFFGIIQDWLIIFFNNIHFPDFLINLLVYRYVSNSNLGCVSYASSYGNIFSAIYIA